MREQQRIALGLRPRTIRGWWFWLRHWSPLAFAVKNAAPVATSPPVLAPPVLWCAECGDEVGDDGCYSVGGNVVFCGPSCRQEWEQAFES